LFSIFNHPTATYSSLSNIAQVLSEYLTGLAVGIGQLWFVVLIIQLYLLYPLLVKFYNRFARQNSAVYILSLLLLVQIGYGLLIPYGCWSPAPPPYAALTGLGTLVVQLVTTYSRFLFYTFYFVLGFFVARRYGAIKQRIAKISLASISLVVLVSTIYYAVVFYRVAASASSYYYQLLYLLTGPFYCLLLILFYLRLSTGWGEPRGFLLRYLEKIGEDSFGIYLVFFFFVGEFSGVLERLGLSANNLFFYPVLFFLTLISSYLSVEAIYRLPLSNIIIGKPRKKESKPTQTARNSSAQ
jgi:surface polysaccharide O-acyltransferase-like enzyme